MGKRRKGVMDTSPEYIKMCEAEEIQAFKQGKLWDGIDVYALDGAVHYGYEGSPSIRAIWLPRQDQLQEMLKDNPIFDTWIVQLNRVFNYVFENYFAKPYDLKELPKSMEELWLAFVMKERSQKTWNGEEWVEA
jgi:hypothetical protein